MLNVKMIVKIHKGYDGKKVIAVCDSDLIGKKFEDGKLRLDLGCNFYKGEEKTEEDLEKELKMPCSVNIVGKKSMKFFVDRGLIDKKNAVRIKNVPHAQCVMVE